jgi:hypothetical protein
MGQGSTVEVGGEVLSVGDTVIVEKGRDRVECPITSIGNKYIHVKMHNRALRFRIGDQSVADNRRGVPARFYTHTEVARAKKRRDLILRLHALGFKPVEGSLSSASQYDDETLERVIAVLSESVNSGK